MRPTKRGLPRIPILKVEEDFVNVSYKEGPTQNTLPESKGGTLLMLPTKRGLLRIAFLKVKVGLC